MIFFSFLGWPMFRGELLDSGRMRHFENIGKIGGWKMRFLTFLVEEANTGRCEVFIAPPSRLTHEVPRQKSVFFPQIMSHGSGKCWPNLSKKGTFLLQIFSIWGEIPPLPPKSCECYICWDPKTARPQCFRCLTVDFRFFLSKKTDPMCFPCFVPFFLD